MAVEILANCTGCGACIAACANSALRLETALPNGFGPRKAVISRSLCTCCKACARACPHAAIDVDSP